MFDAKLRKAFVGTSFFLHSVMMKRLELPSMVLRKCKSLGHVCETFPLHHILNTAFHLAQVACERLHVQLLPDVLGSARGCHVW